MRAEQDYRDETTSRKTGAWHEGKSVWIDAKGREFVVRKYCGQPMGEYLHPQPDADDLPREELRYKPGSKSGEILYLKLLSPLELYRGFFEGEY